MRDAWQNDCQKQEGHGKRFHISNHTFAVKECWRVGVLRNPALNHPNSRKTGVDSRAVGSPSHPQSSCHPERRGRLWPRLSKDPYKVRDAPAQAALRLAAKPATQADTGSFETARLYRLQKNSVLCQGTTSQAAEKLALCQGTTSIVPTSRLFFLPEPALADGTSWSPTIVSRALGLTLFETRANSEETPGTDAPGKDAA